jgi:hypothetical protein
MMKKYSATVKGRPTSNEFGDIVFKGNYREKKEKYPIYKRIIKKMMQRFEVEYDEENDKYLMELGKGMDISIGKEQFEKLYDLREIDTD